MANLLSFIGKAYRGVQFVRGVIACLAGLLCLIAGVLSWNAKFLLMGVVALAIGAFYIHRSRVARRYEPEATPVRPEPKRAAAPLPRAAIVRTPAPAPAPAPARKLVLPLPAPVELKPTVEYSVEHSIDDGGPRFLR